MLINRGLVEEIMDEKRAKYLYRGIIFDPQNTLRKTGFRTICINTHTNHRRYKDNKYGCLGGLEETGLDRYGDKTYVNVLAI